MLGLGIESRLGIEKQLQRTLDFISIVRSNIRNEPKVFCISFQRTGTTSVGQFLKDHGYNVAGYGKHSKDWSLLWEQGNYEAIFKSSFFKKHQAYEDNPWWFPDFYRVLCHRFPKARFILFYRDSDKWFDSMLAHPSIKYLSQTYRHSKIYNRLDEYYNKLNNLGENSETFEMSETDIVKEFASKREHYKQIYELYNREVIEYFSKYAPEKLVHCSLEDKDKWIKLGAFLHIEIPQNYDVVLNVSQKQ